MRAAICILLCAACCLAAAAAEQAVMKVYPVSVPDAADLVEAVKLLAGPDGKVIHDKAGCRFFVSAPPDAHRQIADLLKEANVPLRNVRIDVVIDDSGSGSEAGIGATGSGEVTVTPGGTDFRARVSPFARRRTDTSTSSVQQTLMVRDGGEASIRVGHEVPFEETLVGYGRQWGYIEKHVTMRSVGSSLCFSPRILAGGPLISLRITPELSGLADGHMQTVKYTRTATEVTVKDGETLTLGGLGESRDFYSKFLIGVDRQGNRRQLRITATPHIVNP
jgi:type II secretory pathway component GspD/PulD (secretin)